MKFRSSVCLIVILFSWTLGSASALNCFQCNSNEQSHCSESFNKDHVEINPTSCDAIYEAKYCIKATGMYEGTIGTRRFCSSRHHGNYCEYVKRPGDERYYRSCVYTCFRDGCNGSTVAIASATSIVLLLISVALFR